MRIRIRMKIRNSYQYQDQDPDLYKDKGQNLDQDLRSVIRIRIKFGSETGLEIKIWIRSKIRTTD